MPTNELLFTTLWPNTLMLFSLATPDLDSYLEKSFSSPAGTHPRSDQNEYYLNYYQEETTSLRVTAGRVLTLGDQWDVTKKPQKTIRHDGHGIVMVADQTQPGYSKITLISYDYGLTWCYAGFGNGVDFNESSVSSYLNTWNGSEFIESTYYEALSYDNSGPNPPYSETEYMNMATIHNCWDGYGWVCGSYGAVFESGTPHFSFIAGAPVDSRYPERSGYANSGTFYFRGNLFSYGRVYEEDGEHWTGRYVKFGYGNEIAEYTDGHTIPSYSYNEGDSVSINPYNKVNSSIAINKDIFLTYDHSDGGIYWSEDLVSHSGTLNVATGVSDDPLIGYEASPYYIADTLTSASYRPYASFVEHRVNDVVWIGDRFIATGVVYVEHGSGVYDHMKYRMTWGESVDGKDWTFRSMEPEIGGIFSIGETYGSIYDGEYVWFSAYCQHKSVFADGVTTVHAKSFFLRFDPSDDSWYVLGEYAPVGDSLFILPGSLVTASEQFMPSSISGNISYAYRGGQAPVAREMNTRLLYDLDGNGSYDYDIGIRQTTRDGKYIYSGLWEGDYRLELYDIPSSMRYDAATPYSGATPYLNFYVSHNEIFTYDIELTSLALYGTDDLLFSSTPAHFNNGYSMQATPAILLFDYSEARIGVITPIAGQADLVFGYDGDIWMLGPVPMSGTADLTFDMTAHLGYPQDYIVGVADLDIEFEYTVDPFLITLDRRQLWWDHTYVYRRGIDFSANPDRGMPAGHPMVAYLPKAVRIQNKMRDDKRDVEVLYLSSSAPERWKVLGRVIDEYADYYKVQFQLQESLDPGDLSSERYYIYYGNPSLANTPIREALQIPNWPISESFDSANITYTRPGEYWNDGFSNVVDARALYRFYGSSLRVFAKKGPDLGIIEIKIDDNERYLVDLFNFVETSGEVVFTLNGLSEGIHRAQFRVTGEKNPVSNGIGFQLVRVESLYHNIFEDTYEEHDESLLWGGGMSGV